MTKTATVTTGEANAAAFVSGKVVMAGRSLFLEDLEIGQVWTGGPIEMTEADIVRFAREYDPQPMHVDAEAAAPGQATPAE